MRHFTAGKGPEAAVFSRAYADALEIVYGIAAAVIRNGIKLIDHCGLELVIVGIALSWICVINTVSRKAPLIENHICNEVIFVNNIVYVAV